MASCNSFSFFNSQSVYIDNCVFQYLDSLEARLKEAALKNSTLLQENTSLRKQVSLLEKEVSQCITV